MSHASDSYTRWTQEQTEQAALERRCDERARFAEFLPDADSLRIEVERLNDRLEEARGAAADAEARAKTLRGALFGALEKVKAARLTAARAAMEAGLYVDGHQPDAPLRPIAVPGGAEFDKAEAALQEALRLTDEG